MVVSDQPRFRRYSLFAGRYWCLLFVIVFLVLLVGDQFLFSQDVLIIEDDSSKKDSKDQGSALTLDQEKKQTRETYLDVYKQWKEFTRAAEEGDSYGAETAIFKIIELRKQN
jgi:hypothetical protein